MPRWSPTPGSWRWALIRDAGFEDEELTSHGYLELDTPRYMVSLVDYGADALAGCGEIARATADAVRAEARARAESGRFFGHIAYASVRATRDRPR